MAMKAVVALALPLLGRAFSVDVGAARAKVSASGGAAARAKAGTCDCKSWADVYYTQKASCGRGNELYFLSKWGFSAAYAATEPITGLPHKVCVDFFKNFLTPSCLNVDLYETNLGPRKSSGKQWCYVSNDCEQLNGGEYATNQIGFAMGAWSNQISTGTLAWKNCEEGVDPMLKFWEVQDVLDIGMYSDVSLSRILRLAYPAVNISWAEAALFVEAVNAAYAPGLSLTDMVMAVPLASSTWGSALPTMQTRLGDIIKSEQATVLDSPGHGDNFHVIKGRAVWEVMRVHNGNMAYLGGHFADEFKVTCILGCGSMEPRNAVDLETP